MAGYWHMYVICPYFCWDAKEAIGCEGKTTHRFPKGKLCKEYQAKYCAADWKSCTYAQALNQYYEAEGDNKNGKPQK